MLFLLLLLRIRINDVTYIPVRSMVPHYYIYITLVED